MCIRDRRTVIRRASSFTGYHARSGRLQTGPVTLGSDVLVGENTVLDIGTRMHDRAQLAHSSALPERGEIPAGQRWYGSPAEPTTTDHRTVSVARSSPLRKAAFGIGQLLLGLVLTGIVLTLVPWILWQAPTWLAALDPGWRSPLSGWVPLALLALAATLLLLVTTLRLAAMIILPRLLGPLVRPGRTYPLYGLSDIAARTIATVANARLLVLLFGDSSFIVGYLSRLGYRQPCLLYTSDAADE